MLQITDEDISYAEKIILPSGSVFNTERRDFIRHMKTCDVIACPGSGKTTALLAKIIILASKQPFKNNLGICVLTHTNVAINEIKNRAGIYANKLFQHPNFFGTIQEFTNKFFAIPAYISKFQNRHIQMDDELYEVELRKRYFSDKNLQRNGFIYNQLKQKITSKKMNTWKEQNILKIEFIKNLKFEFDGPFVNYINGETGRRILRGSADSPSYRQIHTIKYGLLKDGYMRYQDAFCLSMWYLQKDPAVLEALKYRFAFIFIDEVQDTNFEQRILLEKIFNDSDKIILQQLGDPNQAIYTTNSGGENTWHPKQNSLYFSDSIRYGAKIVNVLNTVRVNRELSLVPNSNVESINPHLIIFEDGEEELVIPTFAKIIKENSLHKINESIFRAVGLVAKKNEKTENISLCNYYPSYERNSEGKNFCIYNSLISYVRLYQYFLFKNKILEAFSSILEAIVKAVDLSGTHHPETKKRFTKQTLLMYWKSVNPDLYSNFRLFISNLTFICRNEKVNLKRLKLEVKNFILHKMKCSKTEALNDYLNLDEIEFTFSTKKEDRNNYIYQNGIHIKIGTVHSVKGETHTATLYLDTYFHGLDSTRILPQCYGVELSNAQIKKERICYNIKVAHVAFSRPTHLIAFACNKSSINLCRQNFLDHGWIIRTVDNEE